MNAYITAPAAVPIRMPTPVSSVTPMPSRPSMNSQSTQVWPARSLKNSSNGLSAGTPKSRNPSVGLPPLIQAAGPKRSSTSASL